MLKRECQKRCWSTKCSQRKAENIHYLLVMTLLKWITSSIKTYKCDNICLWNRYCRLAYSSCILELDFFGQSLFGHKPNIFLRWLKKSEVNWDKMFEIGRWILLQQVLILYNCETTDQNVSAKEKTYTVESVA